MMVGLTEDSSNLRVLDRKFTEYEDSYRFDLEFVENRKIEDQWIELHRNTVYLMYKNNDGYVLNFASSFEDYDSEVRDFKKSVQSFRHT